MNDNSSLAHTKWNCKYHIVFAPKYRRKIFYGEHREEIGKILRELCNWKQVNIVQAEVCPDHIHKILIAVVIGALLLTLLYALFNDTIMPTVTEKVEGLFNYAG